MSLSANNHLDILVVFCYILSGDVPSAKAPVILENIG
jgi:hypothetical protein